MITNKEADAIINNIKNGLLNARAQTEKIINEERESYLKDFTADFEKEITNSYLWAVRRFYSDYTPKGPGKHYERTYSLINNADTILDIDFDGWGVDLEIGENGFTAPHAWRRVFEGGWHGGSINRGGKRGGKNDYIDSVDGPYYWIFPEDGYFGEAERMGTPPAALMQNRVQAWLNKETPKKGAKALRSINSRLGNM